MQYRRLGASDLTVSEISLGSWLTYGVGVETETSRACLDRTFELGINFVDTANVYGRGAAEEFLGDALAERERSSYVLATKLYFPMSDADRGLSAAQVRKQINASLQRLRTDYVDLYQCHRYDDQTPLEETMHALTEVVREGKARYLGFSEWTPEQIRAAQEIPGVERFVSSQPQYSILSRKIETGVVALSTETGISQIVWSPLAQGVLSGKYHPGDAVPEDSRAASDEMGWAMNRFLRDEILESVQRLRPIASGLGITMSQLALAWVLREPNVASAIVGASRPSQVDENVAASGIELDAATLAAIDEAVAGAVED
ncbi:MAG: aldo/keto reductase family protein [Actinomycetota bacterium]|nr:aldo/keto reductase family protein [Actinomycetota bacterium]